MKTTITITIAIIIAIATSGWAGSQYDEYVKVYEQRKKINMEANNRAKNWASYSKQYRMYPPPSNPALPPLPPLPQSKPKPVLKRVGRGK